MAGSGAQIAAGSFLWGRAEVRCICLRRPAVSAWPRRVRGLPRGWARRWVGACPPCRAPFVANLNQKAADREFRGDIAPLLRPGVTWDFDAAMLKVLTDIVILLPGDPWKGAGS